MPLSTSAVERADKSSRWQLPASERSSDKLQIYRSDPDFREVNLNNAEGFLNIGEAVLLKIDVAIVENGDRATFDDNATFVNGSGPSIAGQKPVFDSKTSSDGKHMITNRKKVGLSLIL